MKYVNEQYNIGEYTTEDFFNFKTFHHKPIDTDEAAKHEFR